MKLRNTPYLIDPAQNNPQMEISEKEWHEIVDPILALRTDLIPWADWTEIHADGMASEEVTWLGESRNDGWRCEGACINPNGISCDSFLVRITSPDGSPFQEIALSAESRTMPTGTAHWEDVNFDGELDVLVHIGGGSGGNQGYAAVLWDAAIDGYREEPAYGEIGNPAPDSEHKTIWDGADTSYQFNLSAWEYLDGELVKSHQLSVLYDSSSEEPCVSYTECELDNGTLSEIQHAVISQHDILDVDSCIAEYAKWEGWNWCDIQHFRQRG